MTELKASARGMIESTLEEFGELVKWDRFVEVPNEHDGGNGGTVDVFGWIARDDGRSDFVLLTFVGCHAPLDDVRVGYTTSSAEHSAAIGVTLHGEGVTEHFDCQRVEHVFPAVTNVARSHNG